MFGTIIRWIILSLSVYLVAAVKQFKSGSTYEIQCPKATLKQSGNMRTYALVLSNAQKNMQIKIFTQPTLPIPNPKQLLKNPQKLAITRRQIQPQPACILNKNIKICVLDGFTQQLSIECSTSGSVSILVVQPVIIAEGLEDGYIREKVIAPVLGEKQRGVLMFRADKTINYESSSLGQLFISNCIISIQYFQHQILVGIQGNANIFNVIMPNQGITGQWQFTKLSYILHNEDHPLQTFSLSNQTQQFTTAQQNPSIVDSQSGYHGIKLKLCTQNITLIKNIQIRITVMLRMDNKLIQQQNNDINRTITIKQNQFTQNLPIKIALFFNQHPLKTILLSFSQDIHYVIQLSEKINSDNNKNMYMPIIEEDQYLYYSYQRLAKFFYVQAHVSNSLRTKSTSPLKIGYRGVDGVSVGVRDLHLLEYYNGGNGNEQVRKISIEKNRIPQIISNNSNPFTQLLLQILPSPASPSPTSPPSSPFFTLHLQSTPTLHPLLLSHPAIDYIFQNQIKRFQISKQQLSKTKSKKLKIQCINCHAFVTYNSNCNHINCCQYAHVDDVLMDIQVKIGYDMYVMVVAASHQEEIAKIQVVVREDGWMSGLAVGKIVESVLVDSEMYVYETDGKSDIQIIVNSQIQSILLLVSITRPQFPTKSQFDYQSNQGYLHITSPKSHKTVYIRLLKMITTYQQQLTNTKIPYSIVVIEDGVGVGLLQARMFRISLGKASSRSFDIQHVCQTRERLYFRLVCKGVGGVGRKCGRIDVGGQFGQIGHLYEVVNQDVIQITEFLEMEKNAQQQALLNQLSNKTSKNTVPSKSKQSLEKSKQALQKANQPLSTPSSSTLLSSSPSPSASPSPPSSPLPQICHLNLTIHNLLQQSTTISVMYYKQKQLYQIYSGQFNKDYMMNQLILRTYCVIDPLLDLNIYAYSYKEEVEVVVTLLGLGQVREIKGFVEEIGGRKDSFRGNRYSGLDKINKQQGKRYKILARSQTKQPSHSQYLHITSIKQQYGSMLYNPNNYTIALLQLKTHKSQSRFQKTPIQFIITQNKTKINAGNRIHYRVGNHDIHTLYYTVSSIVGTASNNRKNTIYDRDVILQTTKLDGNYQVDIVLLYYGVGIGNLTSNYVSSQLSKSNNNANKKQKVLNSKEQPIIIIKAQQIKTKLTEYIQQQQLLPKKPVSPSSASSGRIQVISDIKQIDYNNLVIQYKLKCIKNVGKYCQYITSLQTSQSDIRELTPGVPQIFHIKKHSSVIFIYNNNVHDREFKFKVNRKLGFPNYKLCSYRPSPSSPSPSPSPSAITNQDKCLQTLQNKDQLNLRIQQNVFNTDTKQIIGRTHELIINQYSQQYCINCTYYLALYSDYDIVQGSIFVMISSQPTYLQEGSSITTIVYRGEPDGYVLVDWRALMGVVYQIEGMVEIKLYNINRQTKQKQYIKTIVKKQVKQYPFMQKIKQKNTIPITVSQQEEGQQGQTNKDKQKYQQLYIEISPANNLPSCLYTLVIMSKTQNVINVKDGVPYEMKYYREQAKQQDSRASAGNQSEGQGTGKKGVLSPVIHYRYSCENEGVAMISTKNFQQIGIQVNCRDQHAQPNTTSSTNQTTNEKQTPIDISYLLHTKKSYKISNRLDIPLTPKTCTKYQLSVTTKSPQTSYTLLISSTDIITLPLHKQVPGTLKYQTKLYQIYQISLNQKTQVRCTFKFCQGGDGRIMISSKKKDIYDEIYDEQVQIHADTTFQTIKYTAKPGFFYIKIQYKSAGGNLEYTIYVQNTNVDNKGAQLYNPIQIYKGMNTLSYKVIRMGSKYTQYQIKFYPIVYGNKSHGSQYEIQYYIVESTNLQLLKKTQNCNGQYFQQFVNHHDQIKQTRIQMPNISNFIQNQPITFKYQTTNSYSFATIIPIVYNKINHEFYHLYIPKYRQIQLTNGQMFARVSYILSEIAASIQSVIDIHRSQKIILSILSFMFCCCIVIAVSVGVVLGSRYCLEPRIVYVMREISEEENQMQEDNSVGGEQIVSNNMVREEDNNVNVQESGQNMGRAQESEVSSQRQMRMEGQIQPEALMQQKKTQDISIQPQDFLQNIIQNPHHNHDYFTQQQKKQQIHQPQPQQIL